MHYFTTYNHQFCILPIAPVPCYLSPCLSPLCMVHTCAYSILTAVTQDDWWFSNWSPTLDGASDSELYELKPSIFRIHVDFGIGVTLQTVFADILRMMFFEGMLWYFMMTHCHNSWRYWFKNNPIYNWRMVLELDPLPYLHEGIVIHSGLV